MQKKAMRESSRSFGEKLRWDVYFALDGLRGGKAAARLRSDEDAFRHGTPAEETEKKIRALIRHAVSTAPYYKNYDPEASLSELPVVNKDTFREHYREFLSSDYSDGKGCRTMTTSGSTGTPFAMIQDPGKIRCNTADSIFMGTLGNYRIGQKQAFIRVWVSNVKKSSLRLLMENSIMMDSSSLSDESLKKMADIIADQKVKSLVGYSSALGELSAYLDRSGYNLEKFTVCSVIPISETMPQGVRKRISEQFDCPVRSWYSNEENGIMGIQIRDDSEEYYINSESYYYEILRADSDEPAPDGELGRIVITDLTNYAFPILRYDNGDMAVARHQEKNGRTRLILKELYGRRSDLIYDTEGNAVTPYLITNNLWNVEGVKQFRFLQLGRKEYELRLNGDRGKMDAEDMIGRIRPTLGKDAEIRVSYVDEIPVLASGKRKYIENLCPEYQKKNSAASGKAAEDKGQAERTDERPAGIRSEAAGRP